MMKRFIKSFLAGLLAVSAMLPGCSSGPKLYMKKSANFQYVTKVAVLPFNNLSDDKFAGEKLSNLVVMEILERGVFDVAEEGEAKKVLSEVFREMGYREGELVALDLETIKRISSKLRVQAVFIGTVEIYGNTRGGGASYSVVSISIRLVDGDSGITLWRGSYFEKGSSVLRTIFGVKQKDELELSHDVVKRLFATLF